jgi:glutaryl-CoA dehydrogenase
MDDVFLPPKNLLPNARRLKSSASCLNSARCGVAWGVFGSAEFSRYAARQHVLEPKQFDRPLAANQLIQNKRGDAITQITLGLRCCRRLGRMKEERAASPQIISVLKRNSCGKALDVARAAHDMPRGSRLVDEFHVVRHLAKLQALNAYERTHDVSILGRAQAGPIALC